MIHPSKPLQHELLRLLATAPFWNKDLEWLQSRAAVQSLLPKTITGPDFARLLWLIEELLYEDLLKGSGWGRRRGWFREQLEATRNVAQVRAFVDSHGDETPRAECPGAELSVRVSYIMKHKRGTS